MNIIISLGHPAHYHLFKYVAKNLSDRGHNIHWVITSKDILEKLLIADNVNYTVLSSYQKNSMMGKLSKLFTSTKELIKTAKKNKPDIFVGCLSQIGYAAQILRKQSIFVGEDDFNYTWQQGIITYPFVSTILAPNITNNSIFSCKKTPYYGYQKLSYLHPNQFTPDKSVVEKYFPSEKPYFILRFAQLKAYHDLVSHAHGINTEIAQHLIDILLPHGDVYITSERPLEPQFEKYRLHINPLDIHHVLAFAKLYIGDSQSMSVEAAMLGTPSLRFNDFAGRIGILEELEHKYELTYAIPPSEPERLYEKIIELLSMSNLRDIFQQRRQKMLADKIDVTAFFTWFIENYPESKRIMKENPDYQYRFK